MSSIIVNYQNIRDAISKVNGYPELLSDIPITLAAFKQNFGSFLSDDQIQELIELRKRADNLSSTLGGPQALKDKLAKNPAYLNTPSMPTDTVYASIVWSAIQIHNLAASLVDTYSALQSPKSAAFVRNLLVGDGGALTPFKGMSANLKSIKDQVDEITNKAIGVTSDLTGLKVLNMINKANEEIGRINGEISILKSAIKDLQSGINLLNKKQRHDKIAAKQTEILEKEELSAKLNSFLGILDGKFLEYSHNVVVQSMQTLQSNLKNASDNFASIAQQWLDLAGPNGFANDDQLTNANFLRKALNIEESISDWTAVSSSSNQFSQSALMSLK